MDKQKRCIGQQKLVKSNKVKDCTAAAATKHNDCIHFAVYISLSVWNFPFV